MAITTGMQFGQYEVTAPLGNGGLREVVSGFLRTVERRGCGFARVD